jgi:hypothetical protein
MPVNAVRLVRKMRGGAQAHLIEADDGHFYVVKFRNNPQHRRILINEWVGSTFLRYLGIACPETAFVRIDADFLAANSDACIQLGSTRTQATAGWHFGSRYPGHPSRVAVYDFVPDTLLEQVENMHEFRGVLVFDKWTGNADARQCVFLRARVKDYIPAAAVHSQRLGFVALMVDHGYIFNGPNWDYVDSPVAGLYFRKQVYRDVRRLDDFQPWLDRVQDFPENVVDEALREVPPEWLNGDAGPLESILERLMRRRSRVAGLLADCAAAGAKPFSSWKGL